MSDWDDLLAHARKLERERDEAREALIPFICLNPKSQRVKKKWDGFVQAAKKVLEAANAGGEAQSPEKKS